jgi:hypothetical protein
MIDKELIENAMSYDTYVALLQKLLSEGKTTGAHQSEEYFAYAKINLQRMQRLEKTVSLNPDLKTVLSNVRNNYTWLIITEGWCGDAAQNLPVFHLIEKECPHIELRLVLRDEHPKLMDDYLTNGSRSIPILICLEKNTLKQFFVWGPRPAELQQIAVKLVKDKVPKIEKGIIVQQWYNTNKTESVQREMLALLSKL